MITRVNSVLVKRYTNKYSVIMLNKIPGYMSGIQPQILHKIFSKYKNSTTIGVEIGSLHGRSSVAIANAIAPGKLYCIDKWCGSCLYNENFSDYTIAQRNFPNKYHFNTLEFFLDNTKDISNIIPIKGSSPDIVKDWNLMIDFVFLDGAHSNPSDRLNIDFWLPKIKQEGCFVGHDYNKEYPDVVENVHYLENRLNKKVTLFPRSSLWMFVLD